MIKKVFYGSLYCLVGVESFMVITKFYDLFNTNKMLHLGNIPIAPYWLIVEGLIAFSIPIFIKIFKQINTGGTIQDSSNIANMINKINIKKEKHNGIK